MDKTESWWTSKTELDESRKQNRSSAAIIRFRKRMSDEPGFRARIEHHLFRVLERFRPELESQLIQNLPLWYLANYLCLKWFATPEWLKQMNDKYVTWTVVQEFLPNSPEERKSAEQVLKKHKGGDVRRGRYSKPGTEAGKILEDINTFLSYKCAELVNEHHGLGLMAQDLKVQVAGHLSISLDTLRDRNRRAKQYFKEPQTNSDAIIFRTDLSGIEKLLTGRGLKR